MARCNRSQARCECPNEHTRYRINCRSYAGVQQDMRASVVTLRDLHISQRVTIAGKSSDHLYSTQLGREQKKQKKQQNTHSTNDKHERKPLFAESKNPQVSK